jgi:hypothetical protein
MKISEKNESTAVDVAGNLWQLIRWIESTPEADPYEGKVHLVNREGTGKAEVAKQSFDRLAAWAGSRGKLGGFVFQIRLISCPDFVIVRLGIA